MSLYISGGFHVHMQVFEDGPRLEAIFRRIFKSQLILTETVRFVFFVLIFFKHVIVEMAEVSRLALFSLCFDGNTSVWYFVI